MSASSITTSMISSLENESTLPYFVTTDSGDNGLRLFKKHIRPEDLGGLLYEELRKGMESNSDLSIDGFLRSLDRDLAEANEQYAGEIMVGLMFGAVMAIERSASVHVAEQIISGMKVEFLQHLEEQ